MRMLVCGLVLVVTSITLAQQMQPAAQVQNANPALDNPDIDFVSFEDSVQRVMKERPQRRLTEERFLAAIKEKGIILLDCRTADRFKMRHITGAVNLPLPDFSAADLAKVIPNKSTKVIIYCNNNFLGSPQAMPTKTIGAALNLHTYTTLVSYGYTNVYELGPRLDVATTTIPFEGSEVTVKAKTAQAEAVQPAKDMDELVKELAKYSGAENQEKQEELIRQWLRRQMAERDIKGTMRDGTQNQQPAPPELKGQM